MPTKKSDSVPKAMQTTYDEVVALTDAVCDERLNEEYKALSRQMAAALARKRPSPLLRGNLKTWACAIVYALGFANFLFDPSNDPHLSATELCDAFGVAPSTGSNKSREVRQMMGIRQLDPNWTLPSKVADNPLIWMLLVDGLPIDIRDAPLALQIQAYEKGFIPYIPALQEASED
ncbi:MAG TPA: DUF6398 domain-containing protein [Armatimonadota bacterium]|nr:DUF6398 domain-containing protein [Armatimonadota bacterium]